MAAILGTTDPTGVFWRAIWASRGVAAPCPPWLTEAQWAQNMAPPTTQPVWGRPGAASLVQEPGEIVSGAEIMRRKGITPEVLPG